jgi:hypothetical protein
MVVMKTPLFWNITPYSLLKVNRHFGQTCHLHLQGQRISQERNQHEAGSKQSNLLMENLGLYRKEEGTARYLM